MMCQVSLLRTACRLTLAEVHEWLNKLDLPSVENWKQILSTAASHIILEPSNRMWSPALSGIPWQKLKLRMIGAGSLITGLGEEGWTVKVRCKITPKFQWQDKKTKSSPRCSTGAPGNVHWAVPSASPLLQPSVHAFVKWTLSILHL